MMIREEIGKKINIYRRAKKMTLEELSQRVCKSKSTLSKYEKGAISIDIETLYNEIAKISGKQDTSRSK